MSQGLDMTVNSLPSRTWNWLKMNESKLKEIEAGDTWDVKEVAGESEEIAGLTKGTAENQEVFSHIHTGMGRNIKMLFAFYVSCGNHYNKICFPQICFT